MTRSRRMVEARSGEIGEGDAGQRAHDGGLSAPFEPLLRRPELRDAWRATFDAVPLSCAWGLPTLLGADALGSWLRSSDVLIELSRTPSEQSFACGILLQAASATRAVDRMLGATVDTGAASRRGGPSEAECGLLAYAVARLLAASDGSWILRDVRLDPTPLAAGREPLVHWPFALKMSFGPIDGALLGSPSTMLSVAQGVTVAALLQDSLESTGLFRMLEVGDLLVSDAWWMTDTSAGLSGHVVLAVRGTTIRLRARLEHGKLTVYERAGPVSDDQLALVIAEHELSLLDLARLAGGEPLAFAVEGTRATLERGGATLGAGELVLHGAQLGLRLTELATHADS